MPAFLLSLLVTSPFIPHGHCYLWKPELVWLHLLSDSIIALSYYSIPLTLIYFVKKRKDLPFDWIFLLFGAFIIACGTTHILEVWTLWHPDYWLSGVIKAITAVISLYTAIEVVRFLPDALALISPAQLEVINQELQQQMAERQRVEAALQQAHDQLEVRIRERTEDLATVNQSLQAEIHERQRAEVALQNISTLQQAILDSANYTIISTTVEGTILTFNRAAQRWLGYTAMEVVGQMTPVMIHDREEVVRRAQELSQELGAPIEPGFETFVAKARLGEPDEQEWSYIRKDGTRFPVLLSVTALWDAHNTITGFLGIGNDITERKQAERDMRNLSKALESAVEGISQLDPQGRYLSVNPAYASMVGYQPEEMIGMTWPLTVHVDDQEKMRLAYQQMLEQGKVEVEARGVRKDGSVFDKQLVMVTAYDQQQQFTGHYCFMKDISDRREIERLKDEFISIVSHELRTPLTSVSGALDLLASGILHSEPEEAQRMLTIAANNTDRLVRMINDILDIERIESGKVTMTKQTCDAAQLMVQAVEELEELADRAAVTLSVAPCHTRFWVDPDRILQVLTNLIGNAIKFSPAGATVWVTAELQESTTEAAGTDRAKDATQICFQIRDQGRGIPADRLESIFGRFQQVDASDSRQRGGTGLGLAICRTIVQQHGGQIWAESQLGTGSSFFFTLPCLWEPEAEAPSTIASSGPLILVCDDDPSVRTVVQMLLESQGYHVLTAASGGEAIDRAIHHHPAVILLNLIMPEMDGWQTLARLKQHPETQHIPVIILSGLTPDAQQTPSQTIQQWIVKPPDPQVLLEALENALARPQQPIKVLIIEDDLDLAEVLKAFFHRRGIETSHAQTGREAIRVSQEILPDLLVLDLGLPECDGFEVVDWLRQHNRLHQVPLVVYTARDLDEQDRDRLKLHQTLFFTKGRISPQDFEQRIVQLLNRLVRGQERGGSYDPQSSHH
jgi:PAS domain S-box-containing protein